MYTRLLFVLLVSLVTNFAAKCPAQRESESIKSYAPINNLSMYYEVHGDGPPLMLLHGGIGASETFGQNLEVLAKTHRVIVPHMQGHGLTKDIDRPLRYEQMADDVAALIDHLRLGKVDIMGYSMGGGIALQIAIRHPEKVDRLVIVSTTLARDGWYPEVVAAFQDMPQKAAQVGAGLAKSPLAKLYPDVKWDVLFRKIGEMESKPFDWSEEVAGITAPALLVFADADAIRPEHITDFYQRFGGFVRDGGLDGSQRSKSRLAIVPNTTHYNLLSTPVVGQMAAEFLKK
jgi:pimeloyl-ACP methyl ester carboxylesterase